MSVSDVLEHYCTAPHLLVVHVPSHVWKEIRSRASSVQRKGGALDSFPSGRNPS